MSLLGRRAGSLLADFYRTCKMNLLISKKAGDITGIVVFRGPGSFTGLRIGVTVANSLAYSRNVPIVGELGEDWAKKGISRIFAGESDDVVMPEYGGEANITAPRK